MDATMATLGPEDDTAQGLILPSKVMYRPQAGKSILGMNLVLVRCVVCVECLGTVWTHVACGLLFPD
jgi:hypothetical protein